MLPEESRAESFHVLVGERLRELAKSADELHHEPDGYTVRFLDKNGWHPSNKFFLTRRGARAYAQSRSVNESAARIVALRVIRDDAL